MTGDAGHWRSALQKSGLIWLCIAAVLAMSLPNLFDPMIRYDDYPALFADPDGFWAKTLHEGRWLNYVWHLRGFESPAWLNYALYQALWAVFAACLASVAFGKIVLNKFTISLSLLVLVAPPALLISLWFNTLLPGLALVAGFALIACKISERLLLLCLPVFVIATFMAYTTYPLLLLAVCLVHQKQRSLFKLIGLLALFTISVIAAILLTYTLNWFVHGIFGVPLAEWREATPAQDLQGMLANLPKLWQTLGTFLDTSSFGFAPAIYFHLGLFACACGVLFRYAALEALYLLAGLVTGLTLIVAQVLKLGVEIPVRTFIFIWVFYAIIVVRAAEILNAKHAFAARMAYNAVFLIIASYLLQSFMQVRNYSAWQYETRQLAVEITSIDKPVAFTGSPMNTPAGLQAGVQSNEGFQFRMRQLTGVNVAPLTTPSEDLTLPVGNGGFHKRIVESAGTIVIVFE